MIGGWWHSYWAWTGGNIGAMPMEALITAVVTVLLLRPLRCLLAWVRRDAERALRGAREDAAAARKIAADLYEHHTGERHPAAPADRESEAK